MDVGEDIGNTRAEMYSVDEEPMMYSMKIDGKDDDEISEDSHALTTFGAVLTVVSTMVGGGIVGLPYAFLQMGLWISIGLMVITVLITINQTWLYLQVKDLIPGKPESLYEIGYMVMKRPSIFLLSGILNVNSLGLVMVYFIVYSNTIQSVVADIMGVPVGSNIWTGRAFWVLVLAVLILPICLKKELQELHVVSLTLFVAVCIFILIIFVQLLVYGGDKFSTFNTTVGDEELKVDMQMGFKQFQLPFNEEFGYTDIYKIIRSICCILVAFSFVINLFPLYSALKIKTNANCNHCVSLSLFFSAGIYTFLAICSLFMFGGTINKMGADVLKNVNGEGSEIYEGFVLRFLFIIVLACHIPFIFFSGKESLLIMIDEIDRRSISTTLEKRIQEMNQQQDTGDLGRGKMMYSFASVLRQTVNKDASFARTVSIVRETQSLRQETKVDPTSGIGVDDNQLAYKDMSDVYYYVATIIYFAVIVTGSILIPDVDQIFEFVATISVNALGFIFPSVFYFIAQAKFPQNIQGKTKSKKYTITASQNRWMMISSIVQIILGILAFGFGMFNNVAGFLPNLTGEED